MLHDLAYSIIYVSDLDRATAFYRDVLGIPLDYTAPGWVQFKTPGAAIVLHPRVEAMSDGNSVHLSFRVDDIGETHRALAEKGVKFLAPPATAGFGKHATFLDLDDNQIDLIEWKSPVEGRAISGETRVNDVIAAMPEAMEVFEAHGIRICGGCIVLLNASVHETAEYSGLLAEETSAMVQELNETVSRQENGRTI
ncbi:MAG: VOC family protein [Chloroflexi bacterium]|nr:VOC family protein [Chloroflexota bacterium]